MRGVLAHDIDHDSLSVVRATAIALGLPLLVLETTEGSDSLVSLDPAAGAAPGALVLVLRRLSGAATSEAARRLAVARDVEPGVTRDSGSSTSSRVSGEGGIVRFTLGDQSKVAAV
jgi:hypothetical protein